VAKPVRALAVFAHEFWIAPDSFRPAAGSDVGFALRVGERFTGDPVPRRARRIRDFRLFGPAHDVEIAGAEGDDPAGRAEVRDPGLHIAGYHGNRVEIVIDAPKFESYLKEEGLEHVSAERAVRGETALPGREVYSRCAKALLLCGPGPGTGHDRVIDLPLELVPLDNPCSLVPGDPFRARLLFRGVPLAGALVTVRRSQGAGPVASARTDRDGVVRVTLPRAGIHLVTCTHMIRETRPIPYSLTR
jgi:hypothetical protein